MPASAHAAAAMDERERRCHGRDGRQPYLALVRAIQIRASQRLHEQPDSALTAEAAGTGP
jgi:hypothetical protein